MWNGRKRRNTNLKGQLRERSASNGSGAAQKSENFHVGAWGRFFGENRRRIASNDFRDEDR
jgi:hypothetical protein